MKRLLSICLLVACTLPLRAQLRFERTTLDVKTISEDDAPSVHTFRYVNDSDKPVVITRVETTCGCAKPQYTKAPILPGTEGEVSVTFYPRGHAGTLDRSLYVRTNASEKPVRLTLVGTVTPTADRFAAYPVRKGPLRLKQDEVRFGRVRKSMRHVARIEVANAGMRALHLSLVGAPDDLEFRTEPSTIAPDSVADLVFVLNTARLQPGPLEFTVMLDGLQVPPSQREMRVTAEVR